MKRRKILGAVGMLGIPGVSTSIYGTPISVSGPIARSTEPLRLLLSNVDVPKSVMPLITSFGTVWERVLGNDEDKKKFQYDPAGFLEENGIPKSVLDVRDQEVVLLKAFTDPEVIESALSGDYRDFLKRLSQLGVTNHAAKSGLKKQVVDILKKNVHEIKAKMPNLYQDGSRVPQPYAESRELTYLYSQLAPSIEQIAVVAVPVAIAAIAVIYISVVAVVTIGILAGISISVAIAVAITVGAECFDDKRQPLFAGPVTATQQKGRSERQRIMEHAIVQRELLGKRMLVLSPERLAEAQQTARLARLLNQGTFVLEANRQLLKDEVIAFVEAAEEVGLLQIPGNSRDQVIETIQTLALRTAALD